MRPIYLFLSALLLVPLAGVQAAEPSATSQLASEYRGWKSLQLDNGLVALEIVPEIGGRVIQFKLGEKEFLWVNPRLAGQGPPATGLAPDGGWLNYGGDFPVVGCNDAGVIAEPLRASRTAAGWRLTGRFGVFGKSTPYVEWRDAHRHVLGKSPLRCDATPSEPLTLGEWLSAPDGARVASLIAGGELDRVELP